MNIACKWNETEKKFFFTDFVESHRDKKKVVLFYWERINCSAKGQWTVSREKCHFRNLIGRQIFTQAYQYLKGSLTLTPLWMYVIVSKPLKCFHNSIELKSFWNSALNVFSRQSFVKLCTASILIKKIPFNKFIIVLVNWRCMAVVFLC